MKSSVQPCCSARLWLDDCGIRTGTAAIIDEVRRDGDAALRRLTLEYDRAEIDELRVSDEELERGREDTVWRTGRRDRPGNQQRSHVSPCADDRPISASKPCRVWSANESAIRLMPWASMCRPAPRHYPRPPSCLPCPPTLRAARFASCAHRLGLTATLIRQCWLPHRELACGRYTRSAARRLSRPWLTVRRQCRKWPRYSARVTPGSPVQRRSSAPIPLVRQSICRRAHRKYWSSQINRIGRIRCLGSSCPGRARRRFAGHTGHDVSDLRQQVADQIDNQLQQLSRADIARGALETRALSLLTTSTAHSSQQSLRAGAPDPAGCEPRDDCAEIRNAGSIFVGPWTPESVGDYCSGTNHVLPTYGFARTYSGLGVDQFMRQMTVQELTREGLENLGDAVVSLAGLEGLDAHAAAVTRRLRSPS